MFLFTVSTDDLPSNDELLSLINSPPPLLRHDTMDFVPQPDIPNDPLLCEERDFFFDTGVTINGQFIPPLFVPHWDYDSGDEYEREELYDSDSDDETVVASHDGDGDWRGCTDEDITMDLSL